MTWFKVDDGFYDHPKLEGLSMAARGLWVTCGSYCGRQLTDGVISAQMVRRLGGTKTQIDALIAHELWSQSHTNSGAICYRFNDWLDMNPSRESELERRSKERARKAEARAAKQGKRESVRPDVRPDVPEDVRPDVRPESRRTSALPDPTRPDPTTSPNGDVDTPPTPQGGRARGKTARGSRLPDDWQPPRDLRRQMADECPGVDLDRETRKFADYWAGVSGQRGTKLDWSATWRNWIRRAAESSPAHRSEQQSRRFGTRPEDWLPPPEQPSDFVDGEVVDTQEIEQ